MMRSVATQSSSLWSWKGALSCVRVVPGACAPQGAFAKG